MNYKLEDFKIGTYWKKTYYDSYIIVKIMEEKRINEKYQQYECKSKIIINKDYYREDSTIINIILDLEDKKYSFEKLKKEDILLEMI